jgi:hypothetical protein
VAGARCGGDGTSHSGRFPCVTLLVGCRGP